MAAAKDAEGMPVDKAPGRVTVFPRAALEATPAAPPEEDDYLAAIFDMPESAGLEAASRVAWAANDRASACYRHLLIGPGNSIGTPKPFEFGKDELELLIAANRYQPQGHDGLIAFGIRGAVLRGGEKAEDVERVTIEDARPDHRRFRCLIGYYWRRAGQIAVYTGSTVPWHEYMAAGNLRYNLLPTGCYIYKKGTHAPATRTRWVTPALRLSDADGAHSGRVTVLRTDDAVFTIDDEWDNCTPSDNIHCAYSNSKFSSLGCQTVKGGMTDGLWADFQSVLEDLPEDARVDYMLITGAECALAAALVRAGLKADAPEVQRRLGRLRMGSEGEEIKRLQAKLGVSPTGYFGAATKQKLVEVQAEAGLPVDGIFAPATDEALKWGVLGASPAAATPSVAPPAGSPPPVTAPAAAAAAVATAATARPAQATPQPAPPPSQPQAVARPDPVVRPDPVPRPADQPAAAATVATPPAAAPPPAPPAAVAPPPAAAAASPQQPLPSAPKPTPPPAAPSPVATAAAPPSVAQQPQPPTAKPASPPPAAPATAAKPAAEPALKLTADTLREFAPKARLDYIEALGKDGNAVLTSYGINENPRRFCHFMAQVAHECGGFTITHESLKYRAERMVEVFGPGRHSARLTLAEARKLVGKDAAFAERVYGLGNPSLARSLGNTEPGDGYRYRGRGFIQLTGRAAYREMGKSIGVDLEAEPDKAAEPLTALKVAAAFWDSRDLNDYADRDDIVLITKRINGGRNGLPDRERRYEQAKEIWGDELESVAGGGLESVGRRPQLELGSYGSHVVRLKELLARCGYGPLGRSQELDRTTHLAVVRFKLDHGLTGDGVVDETTWTTLEMAARRRQPNRETVAAAPEQTGGAVRDGRTVRGWGMLLIVVALLMALTRALHLTALFDIGWQLRQLDIVLVLLTAITGAALLIIGWRIGASGQGPAADRIETVSVDDLDLGTRSTVNLGE